MLDSIKSRVGSDQKSCWIETKVVLDEIKSRVGGFSKVCGSCSQVVPPQTIHSIYKKQKLHSTEPSFPTLFYRNFVIGDSSLNNLMQQALINRWPSWLQRGGHGVHSPLAYRVITELLNLKSKYVFYDEELTRGLSGNTPTDKAPSSAWMRVLIRVAAFFPLRGVELHTSREATHFLQPILQKHCATPPAQHLQGPYLSQRKYLLLAADSSHLPHEDELLARKEEEHLLCWLEGKEAWSVLRPLASAQNCMFIKHRHGALLLRHPGIQGQRYSL